MNFPKLIVGAFINESEGVTLSDDKSIRFSTDKNGVALATIMLTETRNSVNNGFEDTRNRVCMYKVTPEVAESFGFKVGDDLSKKIAGRYKMPHCAAIVETRQPTFDDHEPKLNTSTNEIVLSDGAPVYREVILKPMLWDKDAMNVVTWEPSGAFNYAEDILLVSDASDAPAVEKVIEVVEENDLSTEE